VFSELSFVKFALCEHENPSQFARAKSSGNQTFSRLHLLGLVTNPTLLLFGEINFSCCTCYKQL